MRRAALAVLALALGAGALGARSSGGHSSGAHSSGAQSSGAQSSGAQSSGAQSSGGADEPADAPPEARAETPERTVARWREALELELPAEVLAEGPAAVAPDGPLAASGEAAGLVALALFDAGREDAALALLDAARARLPEAERAQLDTARARLHLRRDELGACVELLRAPEGAAHPVRWPERPESWLLCGRALARLGAAEPADRLLAGFLERAPRHPEAAAAWHALAQHALARRDLARAREYRDRAEAAARWQAYYKARRLQIRERPDAPLPRLGLAKLWLAAAEPAKARDVLLQLVALAPDFCPGWAHLGEAHRLTGAADAARAALDRAVACDPDDAEARLWRGLLAESEHRDAAARADLERVLADPAREADPAFAAAHAALARVLERAGDAAGAAAHRRRAAELGVR